MREQLGLDRPAGGIFHLAGPSPNGGWRVIEVWESEQDAKRFVARLRPAFEAVGAPAARALAGAQLHGVGASRALEMCVTLALIESVPVSIACQVVSIGIADGAVRSSTD